jgi:hypothetical protein
VPAGPSDLGGMGVSIALLSDAGGRPLRTYTRDGHSLVAKAAPYLAARVADERVPDLQLSEVERAARALRRLEDGVRANSIHCLAS